MSTLSTTRPQPRSPQAASARALAAEPAPSAASGIGFSLFILVNAALFVRPADVVPDLQGVEIYQYLILTCFAFSFPAVLGSLSPTRLEQRPLDLMVLMCLPAAGLSLFTQGDRGRLYEGCLEVFKLLVYYLLFVSLVTTPKRLRILLGWLAVFAGVVVLLSVLDHLKVPGFRLPRPPKLHMPGAPAIDPNRMYGPGIFNDPNDICVLIATMLLIVLGRLGDARQGSARFLWVLLLGVFGVGFAYTQSRGGLLGLFAGLGTFIWLRFGLRRAILLGAILFPGIVLFLGARQASISVNAETGQGRIELWNAGLDMVRNNPLFGVGWGNFGQEASHVAHNSYMNAFGETGLFGGTIFLGTVYLTVWGILRLRRPLVAPNGIQTPREFLDPDLRQLYPYVAGAIATYSIGMMTLTLNSMATTFTVFGLSSVFVSMARTRPHQEPIRFELLMPFKFLGLSVLFLGGMFLFVRLFLKV